MPSLDDLSFETIELVRPSCDPRMGCGQVASYMAYVECDHGFYTFQAFCQRHMEFWNQAQNRKGDTIRATFDDSGHACETSRWTFRYFVPSERKFRAST